MKKNILALIIIVAIVASIFTFTFTTYAAMDITTFNSKLEAFKTTKYNHNSTYNNNSGISGLGIECFGYANYLAYYIFGSFPCTDMSGVNVKSGWTITHGEKAVNDLCPGDIVRSLNHSMFITSISGDTIYYTDANSDYANTVKWNQSISKSDLKARVKKNLTSGPSSIDKKQYTGWVAHFNNGVSSPECTKIQYRYYHYTDKAGNYSVCGGIIGKKYGTVYRHSTGWIDTAFDNMVSNSATSYYHGRVADCDKYGCTDETWENNGAWQAACTDCGVSNARWYREETRTVDIENEHTHTYNSGTVTKAATCTNTGVKTYTCSGCGSTKTETIAKLGHSYDNGEVTKEATCGTSGAKTYTCSKCGTTKTETIEKVSTHTYNNGAVTKEAACESNGTKTYTCTVCSATKNETITKLGHSYDNGKVTKEATCGTSGTKVFTCSTCGATKTEKISKESAHAYDEGVIKKTATCESDGVRVCVCVICNATKTEAIEKLGHDYAVVEPSVEPTCSSSGKTAVEECITCGTTRGGKSISKIKHEYSSEYTVDKEPTCTEKGSKSQYCIYCGEKGKSTSIAKAEHTYGDWEITRAPQPGKKGSKQRMCIYCEHKDTESIAAISKLKNDKRIIMTIGCADATVFGKATANDVAPKIVKSRTMLPARFVAENLGATVEWNGENRQVTITKNDMVILLFIDQSTAYINDQPVTLDSPPFIEGDRTYTPVRFIAEALGATVEWDEGIKQVTITNS